MGRKRDARRTAIRCGSRRTSEREQKRCGRVRFGQRAKRRTGSDQQQRPAGPAWRWAALIGPWPGLAALCTGAPHASAAASLARPTRAGVGGWRALAVLLGVRLQVCECELALKLALALSLEPACRRVDSYMYGLSTAQTCSCT